MNTPFGKAKLFVFVFVACAIFALGWLGSEDDGIVKTSADFLGIRMPRAAAIIAVMVTLLTVIFLLSTLYEKRKLGLMDFAGVIAILLGFYVLLYSVSSQGDGPGSKLIWVMAGFVTISMVIVLTAIDHDDTPLLFNWMHLLMLAGMLVVAAGVELFSSAVKWYTGIGNHHYFLNPPVAAALVYGAHFIGVLPSALQVSTKLALVLRLVIYGFFAFCMLIFVPDTISFKRWIGDDEVLARMKVLLLSLYLFYFLGCAEVLRVIARGNGFYKQLQKYAVVFVPGGFVFGMVVWEMSRWDPEQSASIVAVHAYTGLVLAAAVAANYFLIPAAIQKIERHRKTVPTE